MLEQPRDETDDPDERVPCTNRPQRGSMQRDRIAEELCLQIVN